MWKQQRNLPGINLPNMIILIAAITILASSMIPRLSGMLEEDKCAKARIETQNIGMAILRFRANTGKWPARDAKGKDNQLYTLVSGNSDNPVPLPAYSKENVNYFGFDAPNPRGDFLDNHLNRNQPKGHLGNAYKVKSPDIEETWEMNYWNGSYLQKVAADPWGHAYVVNIVAAYNKNIYYCYVLSAGPDGIIQTDSEVEVGEVSTHRPSGDDIVFLLHVD